MNNIFNELDHRLSVVPRWSLLMTIRKQAVAEHVFNTERMAVNIAITWFDITDKARLFDIMYWAHHHDDLEALMADPPTMVKPYIDEAAMAIDHSDLIPIRSGNVNQVDKNIVKLADLLEGFHFIAMEERLGNRYTAQHSKNYFSEIESFIDKAWPANSYNLRKKVNALMKGWLIEDSTRFSRGGR